MRKLLLLTLIILVAACGIKRELVLPCSSKYHKPTPDDGTAPAPTPTPANTTPCVNNQVQSGGALLTPTTQNVPPAPVTPGVLPVAPTPTPTPAPTSPPIPTGGQR